MPTSLRCIKDGIGSFKSLSLSIRDAASPLRQREHVIEHIVARVGSDELGLDPMSRWR